MKEPRTVSKATCEYLGFAVFTMLMIVELALGMLLTWVLRAIVVIPASWGGTAGWACTVALPNIVFSRVAADRLLKAYGLSRSGTTREIQSRSAALPEGKMEEDEAIERGEGFSFLAKFIPWSEVATCEIETVFNTFGNPVFVQPTLKDKHVAKLLRFDLWFARIDERDRLLKYIKAKLPKTQLDGWDAEGEFCP